MILERPNAGLVLSTNARFYAIVKPLYDELRPDSWAWVCIYFFNFVASFDHLENCLFNCYLHEFNYYDEYILYQNVPIQQTLRFDGFTFILFVSLFSHGQI